MSTKLICDGCGHDVPNVDVRPDGSVEVARAILQAVNVSTPSRMGEVSWDLCPPCFERVKEAVAAVTPYSPRKEWDHVLKPIEG